MNNPTRIEFKNGPTPRGEIGISLGYGSRMVRICNIWETGNTGDAIIDVPIRDIPAVLTGLLDIYQAWAQDKLPQDGPVLIPVEPKTVPPPYHELPDEVTIIGARSDEDLIAVIKWLRQDDTEVPFSALPDHSAIQYLRSSGFQEEAYQMMAHRRELLVLLPDEAQTYWARARARVTGSE